MRALSYAGKNREGEIINLSCVGLTADRVGRFKAHLLGNKLFKLLDLFVISSEQLKEARACTGCSSASEKLQVPKNKIEVLKIKHKILKPKCCALAERRRLSRLEVGVSEAGQSLVLFSVVAQGRDCCQKQLAYLHKSRALLNDVGVVSDVAACRSEVDYRLCLGAA